MSGRGRGGFSDGGRGRGGFSDRGRGRGGFSDRGRGGFAGRGGNFKQDGAQGLSLHNFNRMGAHAYQWSEKQIKREQREKIITQKYERLAKQYTNQEESKFGSMVSIYDQIASRDPAAQDERFAAESPEDLEAQYQRMRRVTKGKSMKEIIAAQLMDLEDDEESNKRGRDEEGDVDDSAGGNGEKDDAMQKERKQISSAAKEQDDRPKKRVKIVVEGEAAKQPKETPQEKEEDGEVQKADSEEASSSSSEVSIGRAKMLQAMKAKAKELGVDVSAIPRDRFFQPRIEWAIKQKEAEIAKEKKEKEKEENINMIKKSKSERSRHGYMLTKKNEKGQPRMNSVMKVMLEKLQNKKK